MQQIESPIDVEAERKAASEERVRNGAYLIPEANLRITKDGHYKYKTEFMIPGETRYIDVDLRKATMADLKLLAKHVGATGVGKLTKQELVDALVPRLEFENRGQLIINKYVVLIQP